MSCRSADVFAPSSSCSFSFRLASGSCRKSFSSSAGCSWVQSADSLTVPPPSNRFLAVGTVRIAGCSPLLSMRTVDAVAEPRPSGERPDLGPVAMGAGSAAAGAAIAPVDADGDPGRGVDSAICWLVLCWSVVPAAGSRIVLIVLESPCNFWCSRQCSVRSIQAHDRDEEEGVFAISLRMEDAMVARQTSWKKKTKIYFTNQSKEESYK